MIACGIFDIQFVSLPIPMLISLMSRFTESKQLESLNDNVSEQRYILFWGENLASISTKNWSILLHTQNSLRVARSFPLRVDISLI